MPGQIYVLCYSIYVILENATNLQIERSLDGAGDLEGREEMTIARQEETSKIGVFIILQMVSK